MRNGKLSGFDKLALLLGRKSADILIERMGGQMIKVRKRRFFAMDELRDKYEVLEKFAPKKAAQYLGITIRYYKKLRRVLRAESHGDR